MLEDLIGSFFNTGFSWFLDHLFFWLPVADYDNAVFTSAVSQIMVYGRQLGFIIPWNTLFFCMIFTGTLEVGILVLKLVMVVIRLIRGGG